MWALNSSWQWILLHHCWCESDVGTHSSLQRSKPDSQHSEKLLKNVGHTPCLIFPICLRRWCTIQQPLRSWCFCMYDGYWWAESPEWCSLTLWYSVWWPYSNVIWHQVRLIRASWKFQFPSRICNLDGNCPMWPEHSIPPALGPSGCSAGHWWISWLLGWMLLLQSAPAVCCLSCCFIVQQWPTCCCLLLKAFML